MRNQLIYIEGEKVSDINGVFPRGVFYGDGSIFNIKPYKTLFHMESEIEGTLKKNTSISEIIKKTFPPGSVTGAPKTKALEIIDSLEAHSRGPYCGAAGILYPNGDFALSV